MDKFIRRACLEIECVNNKEVVKVAGIINKLKNYIKQLSDSDYKESVNNVRTNSIILQSISNELSSEIYKMNKAIEEGDIALYEESFVNVKRLTNDLNVELQNLKKEVKEEFSEKQNIITENEHLRTYNREQWNDPQKKSQIISSANELIKQWHPDHDVPIKEDILIKFDKFNWFKNKQIHFKQGNGSGSKEGVIEQITKLLAKIGETKLSYEEVRKTFEDNTNFDEFAKRLSEAIRNGILIKYLPAAPSSKEPKDKNKNWIKERKIGEMILEVKTSEFILPVYDVNVDFTVGLTDMSAPINGTNKLVITFTHGRVAGGGVPLALRKDYNKIVNLEELTKQVNDKKSFRIETLKTILNKSLIKNANIDPSASKKLSDNFWIQYVSMCNRLGAKPEDLAKVINSESGFDARATNIQNGKIIAKGLNQLIKKTALSLGMSENEWMSYENTSPENQLKYVEKYFKSVGKATGADGNWKSSTQLYVANFAPKYVRQSTNPNAILYSKDNNKIEYEQNKGLDRNKKGNITTGDLTKFVSNKLPDHIIASINKAKNIFNKVPANDNLNTSNNDNLLNILFAQDVGTIEKLTRESLEKKLLPESNVLISLSSLSSSYQERIKFAKSISKVLNKIIGAETNIHSDGNKIELQCKAFGSQYNVSNAIKALCDCASVISKVKYIIIPNTISKYSEVKYD